MAEQDKSLEGKDAQELKRAVKLEHLNWSIGNYHAPSSPEVREHLEWFKDQKFGLMIHWGLYCQLGIKESWPLIDNEWSKWQFKPGTTNMEVKQLYAQLHKGFLPLRFDPDEWADAAYAAGFRYLVFTTKHHDGFCMWDTKTTEYKVTGKDVPWRTNKNADITRALFDAFRNHGMGISAYYSRADFDCPYYWEDGYRWQDGTERYQSYNPDEKPEIWKDFQEYVYTQLKELVTEYGKIDALWFDGGCDGVKLGLPEMTEKLREYQPWMLGVIRGGRGICEDILTPELIIPDAPIGVPWEVCTVMGKPIMEYGHDYTSFGYTFDQDYKSAKDVAHLLLDVVSKGGNLALNLGPQPDGRLPQRALRELEVLANWMNIFAVGIHGTREVAPYRTGKYAFTRTKDSKIVYAFYLYDDDEPIQRTYHIPCSSEVLSVTYLRTGETLPYSRTQGELIVNLPENLAGSLGDIADCFAIDIR